MQDNPGSQLNSSLKRVQPKMKMYSPSSCSKPVTFCRLQNTEEFILKNISNQTVFCQHGKKKTSSFVFHRSKKYPINKMAFNLFSVFPYLYYYYLLLVVKKLYFQYIWLSYKLECYWILYVFQIIIISELRNYIKQNKLFNDNT